MSALNPSKKKPLKDVQTLPRHIAIVMDGNGRWAKQHFKPRLFGHQQGAQSLRQVVQACVERGIAMLTVFAFSSENWNRPTTEVDGLLGLFAKSLKKELPQLSRNGIKLHFAGDTSRFSNTLQTELQQAQEATQTGQHLTLTVCINYGGRWDIAQAAQKAATLGFPLSEENITAHLALAHLPDPDLLIRTGGEMRISNFLLWQSAYTEFFFSPILWPDFDETALDMALQAYAKRERRFGKTSEQLKSSARTPPNPSASVMQESHA